MYSRPVFQWDYRDTINAIDTEQRVIYLFPRQNLEIIFCTTDGITVKFVLRAKCLEVCISQQTVEWRLDRQLICV